VTNPIAVQPQDPMRLRAHSFFPNGDVVAPAPKSPPVAQSTFMARCADEQWLA
jgi:hypothetical protein